MQTYYRVFFEGSVSIDLDEEQGKKILAAWQDWIAGDFARLIIWEFVDIDGDECFIDIERVVFIGRSTLESRIANWKRVALEEREEEAVKSMPDIF